MITLGDVLREALDHLALRKAQRKLREQIRQRLATENYECRLPDPKYIGKYWREKPRVRYKLQLVECIGYRDGVISSWWVYK